MSVPSNLLYSREHEWLRVEGDEGVIGITSFAQQELGEVVFVELPELGQHFEAGDEIGSIESVKAVSEIFIPVSGEIIGIHEAAEENPEFLNEDPFGEGWLIRIRIADASQLKGLMSAAQYEAFIQGDGH